MHSICCSDKFLNSLRGPQFNQGAKGFGDGPKYFLHYDPADNIYFFQLLGHHLQFGIISTIS